MRVLDIFQKFDRYLSNDNTGSEIPEELHDILTVATILPKAPWEIGRRVFAKYVALIETITMFSCVINAT